jgi:hypothetical protein
MTVEKYNITLNQMCMYFTTIDLNGSFITGLRFYINNDKTRPKFKYDLVR